MKLKALVVITVEFKDEPKGVYWLYEKPDGGLVEEVVTRDGLPDHETASLLLRAAGSYLNGSTTGQIVQAAISSCKINLMRAQNEKGNLSTFEDELPF